MGYVEGLLGKNERIVIKTRQHWMVLARSLAGNLFFALVIGIAAIALAFAFAPGLGLLIFLLIPGFLFLRDYLVWHNNEYLVTTRRVMHARGVVNKHVIDSSLDKVNDVVLDQSYLGRMFDYGDVEILTASEIGVNKLHHIAQPVKFKTEMLNQKEALEWGGNHSNTVPDLIAELDELRQRGVLTEAEFQQKKAQLLSKM